MKMMRTSALSAAALAVAMSLGTVACDNDRDLDDKIEDAADEVEDEADEVEDKVD